MKRIVYVLFTLTFIVGCSQDEEEEVLSAYQKNVITYFQEIALGFEFGTATEVTRKWNADMIVFVGGNPGADLSAELQKIILDINSLTDGFQISTTQDSVQSNCYLFFGTASEFVSRFPSASSAVQTNYGLFYVKFDAANYIYKATVFVDTNRTPSLVYKKHLLREELTQSLGLAKDSPRYPDSIFQESWTSTTSFSQMDKHLITLLYHSTMPTGLDKEQVELILTRLVRDLKISS